MQQRIKSSFKQRGVIRTALAVLVILGLLGWAVLSNVKLFNALVWRAENLQSKPNTSQLIYERRLHSHHLGQARSLPPDTILFFGDSIIQLMPTNVFNNAANFGIGGETIERLRKRLADHALVKTAPIIVLNGGANDLFEGQTPQQIAQSWELAIKTIQDAKKIELSQKIICLGIAVSPDTNTYAKTMVQTNELIKTVCDKYRLAYIDATPTSAQGYASDQLHLSVKGYEPIITSLQKTLTLAKP
jgi:GDSL-like Lipase/Acylhydrolase family